MKKKESLRSISEQLGLSPATVYRALNSCGNVSSETSARIRCLARGGESLISGRRSPSDCAVILPAKPKWFWGQCHTRFLNRLEGLAFRVFLYSGMDDEEGFRSAFTAATSLNPGIALVAAPDRSFVRDIVEKAPFPIFFFCESISSVNSFVFGADPFADGYSLGQTFSARFPHCRSLLRIRSGTVSSLSAGRTEGFRKGASGIERVRDLSFDGYSKPYAAALLARCLAEAPDFDCVYCDNGFLPEICLALQKCHVPLSVPCVGFEDSPALEQYRKNGRILLISSQDLERQVDLCVEAARTFLETSMFPDRKISVVPSVIK